MARKGHIQKRDVLADPKYNSKIVTKLINSIMLDGKKGVAQKIVYGAFDRMEKKADKPAIEVFESAMNNIMPVLEVKARRVGGASRTDARRWHCAGSPCIPEHVARRPWKSALQENCWMLPTTPALQLREKKICTRWQKPTRLSRTIVSDGCRLTEEINGRKRIPAG